LPNGTQSTLGDRVEELLAVNNSLLLICNTDEEIELLEKQSWSSSISAFSLTGTYRDNKVKPLLLVAMERSQSGYGKVLCIAREPICDYEYDCVLCLNAGLEMLFWASRAARKIYLMHCMNENLDGRIDVQARQDACLNLMQLIGWEPNKDCTTLDTESVRSRYYKLLENELAQGYEDCTVAGMGCPVSVVSMLASNTSLYTGKNSVCGKYQLNQAFASAGAAISAICNT
jgi:hypothetical protein